MGFSQVRIWELVYLVQVTIMINDPQIFAMKITRSFTSDTFKTGDLLDYLIFSDVRGRGPGVVFISYPSCPRLVAALLRACNLRSSLIT